MVGSVLGTVTTPLPLLEGEPAEKGPIRDSTGRLNGGLVPSVGKVSCGGGQEENETSDGE